MQTKQRSPQADSVIAVLHVIYGGIRQSACMANPADKVAAARFLIKSGAVMRLYYLSGSTKSSSSTDSY